jgi:hypothetical protein
MWKNVLAFLLDERIEISSYSGFTVVLYLEDSLEPNVGVLTRRGLELPLIVKQPLTLHDVCDSLASVQTAPLRVCPPDVDL